MDIGGGLCPAVGHCKLDRKTVSKIQYHDTYLVSKIKTMKNFRFSDTIPQASSLKSAPIET